MRKLIQIAESITELSRMTDPQELVSFNIMFTDAAAVSQIEDILTAMKPEKVVMSKASKIANAGFHVWATRTVQEAIVRKVKMARIEGVSTSEPAPVRGTVSGPR